MSTESESFDSVVKEFIDFVNSQCGAYMDALAGYAGHATKIERQVHRIMRPSKTKVDEAGQKVVVCTSYEDPSRPDIVLNRIIRASDYIAINAPGGSNEQQHARAILIFIYTSWELEIRPRLALSLNRKTEEMKSDIMGDLRVLRNVVLHDNGFLKSSEHKKLKQTGKLFPSEAPLHIGYEDLHQLFVLIKQDCARMFLEWAGALETAPIDVSEIKGLAIQSTTSSKAK